MDKMSNIKIDTLQKGAIGKDFCMSKMFGRLDLRQLCGCNVTSIVDGKRIEFEPVKNMVHRADMKFSQEVLDQLYNAPKYIVTSMDVISSGKISKHNIEASRDGVDNDNVVIDTYMGGNLPDYMVYERYEKGNTDVHNKGVFYLMSEIEGTVQLFAVNVLSSGHSGKSVSLMYLPNGDMERAILLERVCYHGKQGNEHIGETGDHIGRTDVHLHRTDEAFIDRVVDGRFSYPRKIKELNSPTSYCISKDVLPDEANISRMVDYAMSKMHIDGLLPHLQLDTRTNVSGAVASAIDQAICYKD